jgi:hypothetical protein
MSIDFYNQKLFESNEKLNFYLKDDNVKKLTNSQKDLIFYLLSNFDIKCHISVFKDSNDFKSFEEIKNEINIHFKGRNVIIDSISRYFLA